MSNQPVIFNIQYTPFKLNRNASDIDIVEHRSAREFYDMSGGNTVYKYMTTEGKIKGKKKNALEYLQKNTGVFNHYGMIDEDDVKEMKKRAIQNQGNIWHGFISFNEEESRKINSPEKCIRLVKNIFPTFFQEAHLNGKNIDLMCALHLDRPHHLHIHFVFWEKEPTIKGKDGTLKFRSKGKISETAIDNMFVRLGLFADDYKNNLYNTRDYAITRLKGMTAVKTAMTTNEQIRKKIIALAKELPTTGRLGYDSMNMESLRGKVDNIVNLLLDYDGKARKADLRFYNALEERKRAIKNICGNEYAFSDKNIPIERIETNLPRYHYKIDEKNIKIIEKIEADYKRRQGNLVIGLCKFIKPEYYERKKGQEYKASDKKLRRSLSVSKTKIGKRLDKFFLSFGAESESLERDFANRLHEIEREIEMERARENGESLQKFNEERYKY